MGIRSRVAENTAVQLVNLGVPQGLAIIFADAVAFPLGKRSSARSCMLELNEARQRVFVLEQSLGATASVRGAPTDEAVQFILGTAVQLFGVAEGLELARRYLPAAVSPVTPEDVPMAFKSWTVDAIVGRLVLLVQRVVIR